MEQKDYILIAQTIREINARVIFPKGRAEENNIVEIFGEALKKDNPSFNVKRFKEYCHGIPSTKTSYEL